MNQSLDRYVSAQRDTYESALCELQAGAKHGHWMWFIFPQIKGLGQSEKSLYYGIADLAEAKDYLEHPLLGPRLLQCTRAVLDQTNPVVSQIFLPPDDLKFASCMTLFSLVPDAPPLFEEVINLLLDGHHDAKTLRILREKGGRR